MATSGLKKLDCVVGALVLIGALNWGLVGLFGQYDQKPQAFAGVVLNLAPFVLAAVLGLEVPWVERAEEVQMQQVEQMTEQEKAHMRVQKRQEMMQKLRQMKRPVQ